MSELDEMIRESLRAQVAMAPPLTAPADRAISAARRIRQRHAITSLWAGVIVLALAGGAVAVMRDGWLGHHPVTAATQSPTEALGPSPSPTAQPSTAATTARFDRLVLPDPTDLVTADGRTIPLTDLDGPVGQAHRVVDGWLITTPTSLWLVSADATKHKLLQPLDGLAVAPDRVHLAWRASDRLYIGHLNGTTLTPDQSTPAPARGAPIAYTGSAVVLGYSLTGGGIDHHDVWVPARGNYSPSWDKTQDVVAVYQPAPDGTLYGVANIPAAGKHPCLAVFDPLNDLRVTQTACGPQITIDPTGLVSPDGQWLAAWSAVGTVSPPDGAKVSPPGYGTVLVRLDTVFTNPVVSQTFTAGTVAGWLNANTLLIQPNGGPLVLAHVGDSTLTPISGLPAKVRVIP
jgi:hypothetical protein